MVEDFFCAEAEALKALDELVSESDFVGRNHFQSVSFSEQVEQRWLKSKESINAYITLLQKLQLADKIAGDYLVLIERLLKSNLSLKQLKSFSNDVAAIADATIDLKQIHEGFMKRCYERFLLSKYLARPDDLFSVSETPEIVAITHTRATTKIDDLRTNLVSQIIAAPKSAKVSRQDVEDALVSLVTVLSSLRKELLQGTLQSTSVSFERVIRQNEKFSKNAGFNPEIIDKYGRYLWSEILNNPKIVFHNYLNSVIENFRQSCNLAAFERDLILESEIPADWWLAPEFLNLRLMTTLSSITRDHRAICLVSNYYFEPIFLDYDLRKSQSWAFEAAIGGSKDALAIIYMIELANGDIHRAVAALKCLYGNTNDPNIAYMLACLLFNEGAHEHFDYELAAHLTMAAAAEDHPAALCLEAANIRSRWLRSHDEDDFQRALQFYKRSADLGFGSAKLALEELELCSWTPSDPSEQIPEKTLEDLTKTGTAKEIVAVVNELQRKKRISPIHQNLLYELAERHRRITIDFLIGRMMFDLGAKEQGLTLIERAGRKGHPEACLFLSKVEEKQGGNISMAIWWEEQRLKNELFFRHGARDLYPFARLHNLKVIKYGRNKQHRSSAVVH
ncbi:MAG: hypothetical protein K2X77_11750 [Candidatus Obscuribacterales bacterium]|nr:hypothetical protein [Candidatus Obscuribacterales bacterium]